MKPSRDIQKKPRPGGRLTSPDVGEGARETGISNFCKKPSVRSLTKAQPTIYRNRDFHRQSPEPGRNAGRSTPERAGLFGTAERSTPDRAGQGRIAGRRQSKPHDAVKLQGTSKSESLDREDAGRAWMRGGVRETGISNFCKTTCIRCLTTKTPSNFPEQGLPPPESRTRPEHRTLHAQT